MNSQSVLDELESMANDDNVEGMKRFGIRGANMLGISVVDLRKMAKRLGKSHELALQLWSSGIHEARLLASMVDEPGLVTREQLESWVRDFDSWDICDQCCSNLFDRTQFAIEMINEWASREEEYVRRAAFALMATTAVHAKDMPDGELLRMFPLIEAASDDERNFVKKSVNWALRQLGKRSKTLHGPAVELAARLAESTVRSRRWIGRDAFRELTADKTIAGLR